MNAFREVALYGAQIHAVAQDVIALKPRIEQALQEAGVRINTMDVIAPSLEDVFISSVQGATEPGTEGPSD
jgi:hypothetical protein